MKKPKMNAIDIRDKKLVPAVFPIPDVKPGEILVEVRAAGVNRPDILQRQGLYPPPAGVTAIPGLEIAGVVVASKAAKYKKGDKVCALVAGGGYAEFCAVPAQQALRMPKGMDFIAAAALPETFFTVWTNLVDRGNLKKGETLLVHGGASGIGTTAIQVAKALGAKVFVTAGENGKCKACEKLGAVAAINYKAKDFVAEIMRLTEGCGVDVILDMVGGDYLNRNLQALAPYGRHVSIAMQRGRAAEVDLFQIMSKRLILTGSTLRPQPVAAKGAIAQALLRQIWPLLDKKKIQPVIDKAFALKDAQAAHDYLESGKHIGKVVLKVS